jgi:hypothetical protein
MHRDLRVIVFAHQRQCFQANCPVAECGSFRGARYDSDVLSHRLRILSVSFFSSYPLFDRVLESFGTQNGKG